MTREQLIEICIDAVVHHTKWCNRDSYCAQKGIQSVYEGLTAGLDFSVLIDDSTIIVEFLKPIDFDKLKNADYLSISSIDEYFKDCDPEYETEMFSGEGINFNSGYTQTYIPTRKRLSEFGIGNDWY